jgi:hypothetical protein
MNDEIEKHDCPHSRDVDHLLDEVARLTKILNDLGFCSKDGESMPCMTCGAGL